MGVISASASADVAAPIERCYEVAADVERAPSWQNGFDGVTVVERDGQGRPLIADVENDAKIRMVRTRMRFSYDPPRGMRWHQIKGDTKSVAGSWAFVDLGDGRTRATYSLAVDPGFVLGMLAKGPVEQKVKDILVGGRPQELKEQVERG